VKQTSSNKVRIKCAEENLDGFGKEYWMPSGRRDVQSWGKYAGELLFKL
jgi:hypothetical protein